MMRFSFCVSCFGLLQWEYSIFHHLAAMPLQSLYRTNETNFVQRDTSLTSGLRKKKRHVRLPEHYIADFKVTVLGGEAFFTPPLSERLQNSHTVHQKLSGNWVFNTL